MSNYDSKKLREYITTLRDTKQIFISSSGPSGLVHGTLVDEYVSLLEDSTNDLPNLLKPLNKTQFFSHDNGGKSVYYRADGILMNIARNISIIQAQQESAVPNPAVESRDFSFVQDDKIRAILSRDFQEVQRAIISNSWKSAIILAGSSIEAILLDLLKNNKEVALNADSAPSSNDLDKWDLNQLINVAVEIELVDSHVANLGHSVRGYRNLIHPGVEVRTELKIEPEEANMAFEILKIIIRELSKLN